MGTHMGREAITTDDLDRHAKSEWSRDWCSHALYKRREAVNTEDLEKSKKLPCVRSDVW